MRKFLPKTAGRAAETKLYVTAAVLKRCIEGKPAGKLSPPPSLGPAGEGKGEYFMGNERELTKVERYLNGLRRYSEKGIPIYVDGAISGPKEWERLFEIREDGMFYMGDYVQADAGGLKEIRFDRVYLAEQAPDRGRRRGYGQT